MSNSRRVLEFIGIGIGWPVIALIIGYLLWCVARDLIGIMIFFVVAIVLFLSLTVQTS